MKILLSQEDQAIFEHWLENYASEEERLLSYDEQVKCHILWINGEGADVMLDNIIDDDGVAH